MIWLVTLLGHWNFMVVIDTTLNRWLLYHFTRHRTALLGWSCWIESKGLRKCCRSLRLALTGGLRSCLMCRIDGFLFRRLVPGVFGGLSGSFCGSLAGILWSRKLTQYRGTWSGWGCLVLWMLDKWHWSWRVLSWGNESNIWNSLQIEHHIRKTK